MKKLGIQMGLHSDGVADRIIKDEGFNRFISESLVKFNNCDWGDCCEEDKEENNEAIESGSRIFATYIYPADGTKIFIITEADRSKATVLFPYEY